MSFPSNALLPVIAQMRDADDDRARARILLALDDATVLKHAEIFQRYCRASRFDLGDEFVAMRVAKLRHTRDDRGRLPEPFDMEFLRFRAQFANYANFSAGSTNETARAAE